MIASNSGAALAHQDQHVARLQCRCAHPALSPCAAILRGQLDARACLARRCRTARPSLPFRLLLVGRRSAARFRPAPGAASGTAVCGGTPARRRSARERRSAALNTWSTAPSTLGAGAERVMRAISSANSRRRFVTAARNRVRISSKARGAAPWNEKIDCFSSPTANIVRRTFARAPPGGELRRRGAARCPIASGWYPAPRRSAHGRCRDRACRAPRRPTRRANSASVLSIRSS